LVQLQHRKIRKQWKLCTCISFMNWKITFSFIHWIQNKEKIFITEYSAALAIKVKTCEAHLSYSLRHHIHSAALYSWLLHSALTDEWKAYWLKPLNDQEV
jgi:hypothetical protein